MCASSTLVVIGMAAMIIIQDTQSNHIDASQNHNHYLQWPVWPFYNTNGFSADITRDTQYLSQNHMKRAT